MRQAALLLAALLLPAVAGGEDWRGPAALEVQVEDAKGRNLAGAEVLLVYLSPEGGGSLPSVLTDASGKANIGGLAAGRWSAEVRHAGQMSFRAELTISAQAKPVVQSASHVMAPGATSTMKVKFARGRPGAPAPAAPAPAVPVAPAPAPVPARPVAKAPVEELPPVAAVVPAPAPVPAAPAAKAPVKEMPPAAPVVPAPAPVPAPPVAKAPVKELPPVAAVAPAPAPVPASPVAKAPVKEVAPAAPIAPVVPAAPAPAPVPAAPPVKAPVMEMPAVAAVAPTPAPVPVPAAEKAPVKEEVPPIAPVAPPSPSAPVVPPVVVPPAPVAAAPPAPAPAPAAPAPAPASAPAARARLCVECPPGEGAAWGEAAIAGGATGGCPGDLQARLRSVDLAAVGALSRELEAAGLGCRVIAVELPAGARFTGFRYEAQSAAVAADCLPGRDCPAGGCRFPNEPVLRVEGKRTTLLVAFESIAPELRRAVVAAYSTYNKR